MESDSVTKVFLFIIFLLLSAFFSGSETAYFSLSRLVLDRLQETGSNSARRIIRLLSNPQQLLITILTGNTIVNVAAATVAALLTSDLSHRFHFNEEVAIFLEIVGVTFVLLFLSEVTPKILAIRHAESYAQKASLLLSLVFIVLFPVTIILSLFTRFISQKMGIKATETFFSEEELKTLIEVGKEKGTLEEDEKAMIHSIFEFAETTVREVMVPRIDMVCVEKNTPIEILIDIIKEKGHTRIPLYEERVDNILGIIHAKDLLPYIRQNGRKKVNLASLARPAYFVPESKRIDELLKEFQKEKMHMAIVVDEYGGTAGLITLEDVIEEIVGEIQDEYDIESPLYRQINEQTYVVDAKIDIDVLNEQLGLDIPSKEGYESLGGFIFDITGYVPEEKETIKYGNYDFVIEKKERNRIIQIRIKKHGTEKPET